MNTPLMNLAQFSGKSIMIELMITRNCCYYCKHCMYDCGPKASKEYMSDEVLDKVKLQVDFLKRFNMNVAVNLVGGEPTIDFDKFSHIFEKVMTWNCSFTMTTNGWWLSNKKDTDRFFEIVSKYAPADGQSHFSKDSNRGFNIRISDDPYHEKQRKVKDINYALSKIFSDKELSEKYNMPFPNPTDPWIWRQFVKYEDDGFDSYYIAPNGRGKSVTNIDEWIKRFSKDGNFCMKHFNSFENIHYEVDGSISDTCGFGSIYDFGTVDDNILFIIQLIWIYKGDRYANRENKTFTCSNCREMVQEWKKENLDKNREFLAALNTMDAETFIGNYSYIFGV